MKRSVSLPKLCADASGLSTGSDDAARVMEEMINPCVEVWKTVKAGEMVEFAGQPRMLRYTFIMLAMSGSPVAVLFDQFWRYLALFITFTDSGKHAIPLHKPGNFYCRGNVNRFLHCKSAPLCIGL